MTRTMNLLVLISAMLLSGLVAIYLGKDLNWDLANYHYYGPYAFFHHRYNLDYWPAALNTYFNPTLDFLTYFLINHFPQRLVGFTLGAIQGITIWLTFRIVLLFLPKDSLSVLVALAITVLGFYCPQYLLCVGMSTGDLIVGIFVLGSVYLLLKMEFTSKTLFFSGLLLGLGIGLKLTVIFFLAGIGLSLFWMPIKFRGIVIWTLAVLLGMLCTSGYWMYFLWMKFHNPFFPLFNSFFHSPYFPTINWHDGRFLPKNSWQTLFYPFYFSLQGNLVDDHWSTDIRFLIVYVLLIFVGAKWIFKSRLHWEPREKGFLVFFLFSYIAWQFLFSIMRYAVILQILAPLMIFILVKNAVRSSFIKMTALILIYLAMIPFIATESAERAPWSNDNYFGIHLPSNFTNRQPGTVYFPTYDYRNLNTMPLSLAYLIPFFPENWRFVGVPFMRDSAVNILSDDIKNKITQTIGPTYIMVTTNQFDFFLRMTSQAKIRLGNQCDEIKIGHGIHRYHQVVLCKMQKISALNT